MLQCLQCVPLPQSNRDATSYKIIVKHLIAVQATYVLRKTTVCKMKLNRNQCML